MTPRERAINEAARREVAALGPTPSGDLTATLEYLARLYEAADRLLRMDLPPETWRDRFRRWFR
jgi:hypothetical protein